MRIHVTGAAGFLGSHLAERFIALGHEVTGNDTLIGGETANLPAGMTAFSITDCCQTDRMARELRGCDVLIHTACCPHEGLSVFSPATIGKSVYQPAVSAFSAAVQSGVRRIVHCSSMSRYGAGAPPFVETAIPVPLDPYAIAKVAVETTLRCLAEAHGFEHVIAVPHSIIGPRQRFVDPFRNVVSIMANRNLRGLPAIIYGDGEQKRCFSWIGDCLSCLEKMALDDGLDGEIINIGPDEGTVTINELARLVAQACGFDGEPVHYPDRPREVKEAWCSSDKVRRLLGYETKVDLAEAIARTVAGIRERGPRPFDYALPIEITKGAPATWTDRLL